MLYGVDISLLSHNSSPQIIVVSKFFSQQCTVSLSRRPLETQKIEPSVNSYHTWLILFIQPEHDVGLVVLLLLLIVRSLHLMAMTPVVDCQGDAYLPNYLLLHAFRKQG